MTTVIYKEMLDHINTDELANETSITIDGVDKILMTRGEALEHLEEFRNEFPAGQNNYSEICSFFTYKTGNKAVVEPTRKNLISATTYNDYYKFTMAPVIGAVEDHQEKNGKNVHVTFAVDLRDEGIANAMLADKVGKDGIRYQAKLSSNLTNLAVREFVPDILSKLASDFPPFKDIHESYWNKPVNKNKIFGKPGKPNTLLGIHAGKHGIKNCVCDGKVEIKEDPDETIDQFKQRQILFIRNIITSTDDTTGKGIIGSIIKEDGTIKDTIDETDFCTGVGDEITLVLNGKFIPNKDCNMVVLSMYKSGDAKKQKEYDEASVKGDLNPNPQKLNIEATGKWRNVSWLETSMMQTVYETAHTEDLAEKGVSYGKWLAQALFRTYLGMKYLETNPEANEIKVALFSGRRTGGFLYNLLQVYLWSKLFSSSFHPTLNKDGRNMGTSSVDAWYNLKILRKNTVNLAGTHAHELSMVLSSIYADLDKKDNPQNLVLTQVLGHYLYYKLTHQKSQAPMPMLPDTLGTESFLRAANVIKILSNNKDSFKPLLEMIGSARQDSGKLKDFIALMDTYNYTGGKMASEIDNIPDFNEAQRLGYGLAGVGGALGDSEKAWNTTGSVKKFTASMAVKAVRVFFNGKLSTEIYKENTKDPLYLCSFPVKTGDGDAVKVTADTTLNVGMYSKCVRIANETRDDNKDRNEPKQKLVHNHADHDKLSRDFHTRAEEIIKHSSLELTYNIKYNDLVESNGELTEYARLKIFGFVNGGRRMKSNMRRITKTLSKFRKNKRITKSIRKTRRSYRRY